MKKTIAVLSIVAFFCLSSLSCKKELTTQERIAKVWVARIVKENSTIVYSSGGSNNIKPAYSSYRLNLSSPPTATITEIDGQSYTGTYSVQGDSKIVISGISPEPTGTNGVLEFNINSITEDNTELVVQLSTPYPKTGNTTNEYTLISQ
ncbi:hypothetical protein [Jiulongibacter sediminis]|jgi:hypothetical protein|uniref:hypothetical protein n=1 Tax=Jiulongibacter sediminis TaxID=1605367 RepID=UPI0026F2A10F|nr:hypothetical protein [Jiulongibacter sediminis]